MMIKIYLLIILLTLSVTFVFADEIKLRSPNGKIEVRVQNGLKLTYNIFLQKNALLNGCVIDLEVNNRKSLGTDLFIDSVKRTQVRTSIISPVPEKRRNNRKKQSIKPEHMLLNMPDEFNKLFQSKAFYIFQLHKQSSLHKQECIDIVNLFYCQSKNYTYFVICPG